MNGIWKLLPALLLCAACATIEGETKSAEDDATESVAEAAAPVRAELPRSSVHELVGYAVYEDGGRLWVFKEASEDHRMFVANGEPAKRVTLVGEGPQGRTIMGADKAVLRSYALGKRFARPGFSVYGTEADRLWVFKTGSAAQEEYLTSGEPAKRVTLVGEGPEGRTIMGSGKVELLDYLANQRYGAAGFEVFGEDGRLWVFKAGSENLDQYLAKGEPAKRVTLVGAGPDGKTVMGAERDVLDQFTARYRYGRPGYEVFLDDGRLWVFRANSTSLVEFTAKGEPAKRVTLIGAGPDGRTIMSDERDTIDAYLFGRPGFAVIPEAGRLWIFREGSEAHKMFEEKGEPAKRVTLVGAGPMGKTIMGADRETLDAYLGASQQ